MSGGSRSLLEVAAVEALAATCASGAVVALATADRDRATLVVRSAAGSAASLDGLAVLGDAADLAGRLGAASVLVAPFESAGGSGLVAVTHERAGAFAERERAALEALAGLLAGALGALADTRHELETRVRDRTADLMTSNEALRWEVRERQRAEDALRKAKEAAESASVAKSHFLANMSHELRTPLNSVIGFASVLLKNKAGALDPTDLLYLTRIDENGRHLLGLINDILDLSKIEAGRVELRYTMVDLGALVSQTLGQLEGSTLKPGVRFFTEVPPRLAALETDATKLKQVIINLVGNALKFTDRGSVTVRISADPATGTPLRLDVQDTGIGIGPDRREAIFEPFQQADNTTERRYGGTGLGLAISRSLLQLLGYRIEVQSMPGEGSTFSVHFRTAGRPRISDPAVRAEAPAVAAETGSVPAQPDCLRILAVDDDPDARALLQHALNVAGADLYLASDAWDALRLLKQVSPDLVILDLVMPELSGERLLQMLRNDPRYARLQVAVVTASELSRAELEWLSGETIAVLQKGPALSGQLRQLMLEARQPAAAPV